MMLIYLRTLFLLFYVQTPAELEALRGFKGFKNSRAPSRSGLTSAANGNPSTVLTEQLIIDYTVEGFVTPVKNQVTRIRLANVTPVCMCLSAARAIVQDKLSTYVTPIGICKVMS